MKQPPREWYAYSQVNFTVGAVWWVLKNFRQLSDGEWPPEGRETGYTGASSIQLKAEGRFVKPALIASEVASRISMCEDDGVICLDYFQGEVTMGHLMRRHHCTKQRVWQRIKLAVRYAGSGSCRRWMPCQGEGCTNARCPEPGRAALDYESWLKTEHKGMRTLITR